jgi:hypothetical protein
MEEYYSVVIELAGFTSDNQLSKSEAEVKPDDPGKEPGFTN